MSPSSGVADSRSAHLSASACHARTASLRLNSIDPEIPPSASEYQTHITTPSINDTPKSAERSNNTSPSDGNPPIRIPDQRQLISDNPLACDFPFCNKKFTRKYNLNRHYESVHQGQKAYSCPVKRPKPCNETFNTEFNFRRHAKNVHPVTRGELIPISLRPPR